MGDLALPLALFVAALAGVALGVGLARRRQAAAARGPKARVAGGGGPGAGTPGRDQLVLEDQRRRRLIGEIVQVIVHQLRGWLSGVGTLFATDARSGEVVLRASPRELRGRLEELETTVNRRLGALEGLGANRTWALLELDRLLRLAAHPVKNGDIRVEIDVAPDAERALSGDAGRLGDAFAELVRNAQKAIRRGGRGGRIVLRARRVPEGVVIEVEDDGPGIAPDVLPLIWLPGFTTDKEEGWGFGLFFVREQVSRHGGSIEAENRDGGGAVFRIKLPLGSRDAVTAAAAAGGDARAGPSGPRPAVVLAESEPALAAALWAELGTAAAGAADAPQVVARSAFDVDADAVVLATTCSGRPVGPVRAQATAFFGDEVEWRAQAALRARGADELLVGQAIVVATGDARVPYVVLAPTVRAEAVEPPAGPSVYLAARAAFEATLAFNATSGEAIRRLAVPWLGAEGAEPAVVARQVRAAHEEAIEGRRRRLATAEERADFERWLVGLAEGAGAATATAATARAPAAARGSAR